MVLTLFESVVLVATNVHRKLGQMSVGGSFIAHDIPCDVSFVDREGRGKRKIR